MEKLISQAEIELAAVAMDLGHVLEEFALRQSRPNSGETWKRSVCVNCGMLWDVRWSPEIGKAWGVAKMEQANRRPSRKEDGDVPQLSPRCEDVQREGFGVWSFALKTAA